MTLSLANTLGRASQPVIPLEPGRVRMYSCGPTVYRYAHVGNLRTFLLPDLIRRTLLYHGLEVLHVQNITDVGHLRDERFDRGEDRMLVAAGLEDRSTQEIADAYEAAFHADAAAINLLPAHVFPRATEHIPHMLALAERLVDEGHAYVSDRGNVYYAVASFPDYGRLSGNTVEALRAGHRGEVDPDKRDPADFALWKAAGEGRQLKWPSARWGEGFPGWHLECSAMALAHLGERFDIHTGGVDNVFPHHEDEIAQSAPLVGGSPARHWVHGAFLTTGGRKMAKSAGNFRRITELAAAGIDPLAFRYLALTARYARPLSLTDRSLAAAAAALDSLRAALWRLGPPPDDGPWVGPEPLHAPLAGDRPDGPAEGDAGHGGDGRRLVRGSRAHEPAAPLSAGGRAFHDRFAAALDDDLDLPSALACIREIARSSLPPDERRWLLLDADLVLGLDLDRVWASGPGEAATRALPSGAAGLLERRADARGRRDWAAADALRDELGALGVRVVDQPEGQRAIVGSATDEEVPS